MWRWPPHFLWHRIVRFGAIGLARRLLIRTPVRAGWALSVVALLACRALDVGGHPIVAVEANDAIACRRLVKEAVRRLRCDPDVERFRFLIQLEDQRPTAAEVFCEKESR